MIRPLYRSLPGLLLPPSISGAGGGGGPAAYIDEVLADSPVIYLRLGEASGATAADETANANHGTYVNTPTLGVAGAISDGDTAVSLNSAQTEYISVPDAASLDVGDVFSVEFWAKTTSPGLTIIDKGTGSFEIALDTSGEVRLLKAWTADVVKSTVGITDGNWHHVVVTKDGATVKIYIDKIDRTGTVTNATMVNTGTPLEIGVEHGYAGGWVHFNGSLDEVAVYPTALSAARVEAHYDAATA